MSRQTEYSIYATNAFAGMIADLRPLEVDSKLWEGSVDGAFGLGVIRGTADDQATVPSASTDSVIGFVIANQGKELERYASSIVIEETNALSVMRTGNIYVATEDACAQGGAVFVRFLAGAGGTQLGAVRATAVTDETIALTDWVFEETGVAGDIVKIRKV